MRNVELNWAVRFVPLLSILILSGAMLGGCKSPSLVGTWRTSNLPTGQGSIVYTFKSDGTYESEITLAVPDTGMELTAIGQGKYRYQKDRLEGDLSDINIAGLPDEVQRQVKRRIDSLGKKPLRGSLQWTSPDKFTLLEDNTGTTMFFSRVTSKP